MPVVRGREAGWIGCQSVTGLTLRDRQPFYGQRHACLWTVGERQSTQREHTQTRRGHKQKSTNKHPRLDLNPGPSHCEVTVLNTIPLC